MVLLLFLAWPGSINAVPNGGFEQGLSMWRPLFQREPGKGIVNLIRNPAPHSGSAAARVHYSGEKDWSFEPDLRRPVTEGQILKAVCWMKVHSGSAELAFSFWDVKGANLAWSAGAAVPGPQSDWQQVCARVLIPRGVTHVQPRLLGSGSTDVAFDDLSLELVGDAAAARSKGRFAPFTLQNAALRVTFFPSNGSFAVSDLKSNRTWKQEANNTDLYVTGVTNHSDQVRLDLMQVSSGQQLTADFKLVPGKPELEFELSGTGAMSRFIEYPFAFAGRPGDYLVVPMNEGISYPVDDPDIEPMRLVGYGGHGICMAFYGITDGSSSAMTIIETPDDAVLSIQRPVTLLEAGPQWAPQKGQFGYTRRLRFIFQQIGGHVAIAKRYRQHARETGLLKTLREKRSTCPDVDRLIGAANIWCWDSDSLGIAKDLLAAGMQHLLWSAAQPPEKIKAMNEIGILTSRYDIYQDAMDPANFPRLRSIHPDWTTNAWPHDLVLDSGGKWVPGWQVETRDGARIPCGVLCDLRAPDYARQRLTTERQTHSYLCRFIDTTTASAWRECYHPDHPMTRTQCKEARMQLLDYFSGPLRLVTGSETGHEAAVPYVHYFEGMLSLGPYRVPDSGRRMQVIWTNVPTQVAQFQVGWKYRLPLWELVYHDSVVAQWYWGDYNNKLPALWDLRDRFNLLYGTPPMYMFSRSLWQQNKGRFVRSYRDTSAHVRQIGYEEMTDHRFLTPDRSVQQTRFGNGTVITVNFGTGPYTLSEETLLQPMAYSIRSEK